MYKNITILVLAKLHEMLHATMENLEDSNSEGGPQQISNQENDTCR
jgi:hypothetical protein